MKHSFDKQKIIDSMFDPITSQIIAELEDGGKEISYLSQKVSISENEVLERISHLLEFGFIIKKIENQKILLYADGKKLSEMVENSESFDGAIDGLTKIDSYLN